MLLHRLRHLAVAGLVCLGLAACQSLPGEQRAPLYVELGEYAGIERLIDGLLNQIVEDERIVGDFAEADIEHLRLMLIEQICEASGGPCQYRGLSMQEAHRGLGVTEADFNALVEDLQLAMHAQGLPIRVQNRLLALLAPMHADVVADRAATPQVDVPSQPSN